MDVRRLWALKWKIKIIALEVNLNLEGLSVSLNIYVVVFRKLLSLYFRLSPRHIYCTEVTRCGL
jgi:hypothetical protein